MFEYKKQRILACTMNVYVLKQKSLLFGKSLEPRKIDKCNLWQLIIYNLNFISHCHLNMQSVENFFLLDLENNISLGPRVLNLT